MRQLLLDLFAPVPVQELPSPSPQPAPPPPLADATAHYRHPEASREISLGPARVAYAFKRGRRRSIGFTVSAEGLSVSAPRHTSVQEVEAALRDKARWILSKLQEMQARTQQLQALRIDWREGARLPFLGQPLALVLDPRQRHGPGGAVLVPAEGDTEAQLHIGLPRSATPEQLREVCQAWLMRQARRLFTQRLDHFAPQLQVRWRRMGLSSAGTRWGSASADGSIRLNWRLIHFRLPLIDYVVVHELSHLREMNHSPRFWQTVESVLPDYVALRGELKNEALPPW